jgi:hypothetical protein
MPISVALAEHLPEHSPPLIASREDWNAWVTEDVGYPLTDSLNSIVALRQAVRSLAKLQRSSVAHIHSFLKTGCADSRLPALTGDLTAMMAYLQDAMERQTSTSVPRLTSARIRELGDIVHDAASAMESLALPVTLVHNDANPGNILLDGDRCFFIDWAEAGIGHPFLTFQVLLASITQSTDSINAIMHLTTIYKQQWADLFPEKILDRALALSPLLAIASYLRGRGDWLKSAPHDDLRFQGYARSLARHMDRQAQTPDLLAALCH